MCSVFEEQGEKERERLCIYSFDSQMELNQQSNRVHSACPVIGPVTEKRM